MRANRLSIVDREALKRVMDWFEQEAGSGNRAAKGLGIGQGTFSRLLNGTTDAMDLRTFYRISEGLAGRANEDGYPQEPWEFTFERAPLTGVALERARSLERQRAKLPAREDARSLEGGGPQEEEPAWWSQEAEVQRRGELWLDLQRSVFGEGGGTLTLRNYSTWLGKELRRLRRLVAAGGMLKAVLPLPQYRRVFEEFASTVGRTEPYPEARDLRYWLAVYRAVEPFAASDGTWGMEVSWEELHASGDLAAYLEVALKREALLMAREPDVKRASMVEPRMTEAEWFAHTLGPG